MFLPRSLPLLFSLAVILSPKIYTGLLYYFSQVSVQISSTQTGLPGRSYLNSNSPPPRSCYLSTVFYNSLNSTALHYMIMFICLFLFPPMKCKLPESGINFSAVPGSPRTLRTQGEVSPNCITLQGECDNRKHLADGLELLCSSNSTYGLTKYF